MKRLAVIILNWNGIELLKKFLPVVSLHTRGDGIKVWVADNGSADGSANWVKENHPEVGLVEFDRNYGFAEGYNKAIKETDYPYTVLLNSDVEVTSGWWQPLLDFMENHPEAGACQPKIKSYHNKEYFEYAGAAGGYIDKLGYPFCRGRIFDNIEKDEGQYDEAPAKITWASGACLMVNTSIYFESGGLDPLFFAHMEEIDLCCRMINLGKKIYFVPGSEVYHIGGASLPQENPKKVYLNFRNNLLLLYKNLPKSQGVRKLFARRLADSLAFFMFILSGKISSARMVLKAHKDFRKMKKSYNSFPDHDFLNKLPGADRLIVAEHFLKLKKK